MLALGVVNQKGGVGKSPMTWEIGASLAARNLRVVLLDADPQATLTTGVLSGGPAAVGLAEVLLGERRLHEATQSTATPNLQILTANHARLSSAESSLASRGVDGFIALAMALDGEEATADVLVCDCPPNLSTLTGNVLAAADQVLVPVDSTQARVALAQLKRTIAASRRLNPDLSVLGAILTKFMANQRLSADRLEALQEDDFFPNVWPVRTSSGFERAFRAGQPLRAIAASESERKTVAEIDAIADALEPLVRAKAAA